MVSRRASLLLISAAALGQTAKKKIVVAGLDEISAAELKKSAPSNVHLVTPPPDQYLAEISDADALITPQFTRAGRFSQGLAAVELQNKSGYINRTGQIVIGLKFDAARDFSDGMAAVLIGDEWGYINLQGEIVIKPQYHTVESFRSGLALVITSKLSAYVDHEGRYVWRAQFD